MSTRTQFCIREKIVTLNSLSQFSSFEMRKSIALQVQILTQRCYGDKCGEFCSIFQCSGSVCLSLSLWLSNWRKDLFHFCYLFSLELFCVNISLNFPTSFAWFLRFFRGLLIFACVGLVIASVVSVSVGLCVMFAITD